jgi:flagellar biosynthesis/type III secretory pathway protein FliH
MILSKARIGRCAAVLAIAVLLLTRAPASAAEASGDYAQDLASVYWGYQRMLAMKEACDTAAPSSRPANDKAFAAWEKQHRAVIQELRRHVTAMIRRASQDEKEYARNLGKYEGAILAERQDYKESLLGPGTNELREQCQRMPETLKSADADMEKVYASELEVIRKRK